MAVSEDNLVDIETLEANSNDPVPEETDDPNYNTPAKGPSASTPKTYF